MNLSQEMFYKLAQATLPPNILGGINFQGPIPSHPQARVHTPCWIWLHATDHDGYPRATYRGDDWDSIHIRVYEDIVGKIPEGWEADHLCRRRPCVNPSHIQAVPFMENKLRGLSPEDRRTAEENMMKKESVCAVGQHEHGRIVGCHPIYQHHQFEHRGVGIDTPGEFTAPEPESEEEDTLTNIGTTDVAAAHGIPSATLLRALKRVYPERVLTSQTVDTEQYTPQGRLMRYRKILLTPSQVHVAHKIAEEVKRRMLSRSGPVRIIRSEDDAIDYDAIRNAIESQYAWKRIDKPFNVLTQGRPNDP